MINSWRKLRHWKKGAILVGSLYLLLLLILHLGFLTFVSKSHIPGTGDMGSLSEWILIGLYWILQSLPLLLLYFLVTLFPGSRDAINLWATHAMEFWVGQPASFMEFILFILYSTVIYSCIGAVLGYSIKRLMEMRKGNPNDPKTLQKL